ncbi:MAG: hypothetical protein Q3W83_07935 [Ruminococcus sp.]|nr:hypothetical protein [Ruminococcus sp.]MDR4077845.1 hypothetical protein [Ruminococcus sp.]
MNVYEEIDQETMMLLLNSLCKRTVEGKQIWENMEYNPISFLQKDIYEKEGTCISQMFEATTVFNGIEYELELSESIELPSGKGDIFEPFLMKQKTEKRIRMISLYFLM